MLRDCKRVNNANVTDTYLKMARIGYARVSTTDQDLTTQLERLKAVGCEIIRSEKVTGTTRQGRTELASIIEFLRPGDELVVTRVDRLARSIGDLQDIVRELKVKGAFLKAADQPSTPRRQQGRPSWTCWQCLRSSRPTDDGNGNLKGSPKPRRTGCTK